jgi:hypothetical protein
MIGGKTADAAVNSACSPAAMAQAQSDPRLPWGCLHDFASQPGQGLYEWRVLFDSR